MASFRPRSLTDFGAILWRRKWLLIFVVAAMLQATFMVVSKVPNTYESHTKIAVLTKPGDDSPSLLSQISAMQQYALSREMLSPLIARLQLARPSEDIEQTVARLNKEIKLDTKMRDTYPPFPETIVITYRNQDPKKAQAVVAAVLAHFTQTNEALRQQAALEVQQVGRELMDIQIPLGQITRQRLEAQRPSLGNPQQTQTVEDPRIAKRTLLTEINTLSDRAFTLERQITLQSRQMQEQRIAAQTAPTIIANNQATGSSSYGTLLIEKARLEAQYQNYLAQYTAQNPKVIETKVQLEQLADQIEQLKRANASTANTPNSNVALGMTQEGRELRSMEREMDRLRTELELTNRNLDYKRQELARLPATPTNTQPAAVLAPLGPAPTNDAEYERLSKRYMWLLDRKDALEKAQVNISIGPNLNLFRLIDAPNLPAKPAAPNRNLLRLAGLGIALGIGLLLVGLLEARQFFRIHDERDVQYYLGAPVVGLIPETLTTVEASHKRRQQFAKVSLVAVAILIAIPVLALVLRQIGIFDVLGSK